MCKKIVIILTITFCMLENVVKVYADDIDEEAEDIIIDEILQTVSNTNIEEPKINSRAGIIFDRTTKKVIWGKNENEKRAMASTTKIMTAIVVLEKCNLSDVVVVSKKAASTGGSRLKINENDKITINDLLYGLMLKSRE